MKFASIVFWLLISNVSVAATHGVSASRKLNESWLEAMSRHLPNLELTSEALGAGENSSLSSPLEESQDVANIDFSQLPKFSDASKLMKAFQLVRDTRYLNDGKHSDFPRRISWLYPVDGCWIRASAMNDLFSTNNLSRLPKIFVFGDLVVQTNNSPSGEVSWWYHVAPIALNAENKAVVFDPAINPNQPIPVKEWVNLMNNSSETLSASLCDDMSFDPTTPCHGGEETFEILLQQDLTPYLSLEWENIISLGRDPKKDLGDLPPWLKAN